jgi:chromate transporter
LRATECLQVKHRPRTWFEIARVFLRLSLTGFGGPNAHLALMEHELVTRRAWITREQFLRVVALTNLLPGPNSSEVAIHLGIVRGGPIGGLVSGLCFIVPTVALMTGLASLYFAGHRALPIDRPLRGIAPVVIALIAVAGARLSKASVKRVSDLPLALLGVAAVAFLPRWELAAMALGGVVGLARSPRIPPVSVKALVPWTGLAALIPTAGLASFAWIFFRAGAVLFGGGYFLLPLLEPRVVLPVGWLTQREFLDGLALVHALPGPITSVCAFYGYRAHGVFGAAIAMTAVYLPAFVAVFAAAPWLAKHEERERVRAALDGVNPVVAGTILGAAAVYAAESLHDVKQLGIGAIAAVLLTRTKVNAAWVVLGGAVVGLMV